MPNKHTRAPKELDVKRFGSVIENDGIHNHRAVLRPFRPDERQGPDFATPFEVLMGKTYYVVKVTYGSGDSFQQTSGHVAYVDLFETVARANACAEAVALHNLNIQKDSGNGLSYLDEHGHLRTQRSSPWIGHFESLESIDVVLMTAIDPEPLFNFQDFQKKTQNNKLQKNDSSKKAISAVATGTKKHRKLKP